MNVSPARALLLCPPDYYGIEYEINPWMSRARGAEAVLAKKQWQDLYTALSQLNCQILRIPPQPKLPDMVFTANAGLAVGTQFIPSNFRHKERAGEAPHFATWMEMHGYQVASLHNDYYFEGEGDALFSGDVLFCLAVSVELVDPRFYHLDTCFCPLPDGSAMWFPSAFDEYGQHAVREHISDLIEVAPEEAMHFSCNAVVIGRDVVMPEGAPQLAATLKERGYQCHQLAMTEFLKAGGACKCLTLFLPQRDKI
jgi:arginine dihydrolase